MELNYNLLLPSKIDSNNIPALENTIIEIAERNKYLILDCSHHKNETDSIISLLIKSKKITDKYNCSLFLTNVNYNLFENITENGLDSIVSIFYNNIDAEEEIVKRERPPHTFLIDDKIGYYEISRGYSTLNNKTTNGEEEDLVFGEGKFCIESINVNKKDLYMGHLKQNRIIAYKKFGTSFCENDQVYIYKPNPSDLHFTVTKAYNFSNPSGIFYINNTTYAEIAERSQKLITELQARQNKKLPQYNSLAIIDIQDINTFIMFFIDNPDEAILLTVKRYKIHHDDCLKTLSSNLTATNIVNGCFYRDAKYSLKDLDMSEEIRVMIFSIL